MEEKEYNGVQRVIEGNDNKVGLGHGSRSLFVYNFLFQILIKSKLEKKKKKTLLYYL